MLRSAIDHIVIVAPSLAAGAAYVRRELGVEMRSGGEHARMGTHNLLLKLGDAAYLEVIAVNPAAASAGRPRWFDLDHLDANAPPRLATWVVCTSNIRTACADFPIPLGEVESMSRGSLRWLITVPSDGSLPMQGIAPTLIQWLHDPHPAATLPDSGCSLVRVEATHADAAHITSALKTIGFKGNFSVSRPAAGESPRLVAIIDSPAGRVGLGAPAQT